MANTVEYGHTLQVLHRRQSAMADPMPEIDTYQHPVLDRGGSRARGGTLTFVVPTIWPRVELAEEERSSFGAITGSRIVGFFADSPL